MDPFEEFEMKPITEGLGFHKKASAKSESISDLALELDKPATPQTAVQANPTKDRLEQATQNLDDLLSTADKAQKKVSFTNPLPRMGESERANRKPNPDLGFPLDAPATIENPFKDKINPAVDTTPGSLIPDPQLAEHHMTQRGSSDSLVDNLKPVSVSFASSVLDIMIVFAVSLIFMVSLLLVTGVQLETIISSVQIDLMTQIVLAVFYLSVYQMYILVSRCFFGKTLGEWTFEYQMGDDEQIEKTSYPLKIIVRSLVHILTGFVVLPLLSFLFKKDLSYYVTGLQLYQRR